VRELELQLAAAEQDALRSVDYSTDTEVHFEGAHVIAPSTLRLLLPTDEWRQLKACFVRVWRSCTLKHGTMASLPEIRFQSRAPLPVSRCRTLHRDFALTRTISHHLANRRATLGLCIGLSIKITMRQSCQI